MGAKTIEKILARTSGKSVVRPGETAVCRPDIVLHIDLSMAIEGAWYRPKKIFDPQRVVVIFDHAVPAPGIKNASAMQEGRRMVKEFGLKQIFDVGDHGIAHVVAAENGLARPGELLVCTDSHTCASGALNCAGRGVGTRDALQAMTKGMMWYPVTPTIRYEFKGSLKPMVSGKDVFFHIAQTWGSHGNTSIEYG
ncbi:MAG: aconitase family protein, partial [Burkholderiales bacterium]